MIDLSPSPPLPLTLHRRDERVVYLPSPLRDEVEAAADLNGLTVRYGAPFSMTGPGPMYHSYQTTLSREIIPVIVSTDGSNTLLRLRFGPQIAEMKRWMGLE